MKLIQARKVLEKYRNGTTLDTAVAEAINTAIVVLGGGRSAEQRIAEIRQRIAEIRQRIAEAKDGFDPFAKRTRLEEHVFWRYAVFYKMSLEGYMYTQIGRVSGYNHATVWTGIHSLMTSMEIGYAPAIKVWNELIELLEDDD